MYYSTNSYYCQETERKSVSEYHIFSDKFLFIELFRTFVRKECYQYIKAT